MKLIKGLLLLILLIGISSARAQEQEEELDFSDLEQVEKEEFGEQETPVDESADFDLEGPPSEEQSTTTTEDEELDKELDVLDGEQPLQEETVELPPLETPSEEAPPTEVAPEPEPPIIEPPPTQESLTQDVAITDEPNHKLEERLSRIYQKFMAERTSDEEWLQIAGDKAAETYTVQQGDTLWDISVTFFGSGHFWPKLWQLNDDITNPHVIRPGRIMRFSPGTFEQPPRLEIADGAPIPPPSEGEEDVAMAQPELPPEPPELPPAKVYTPSLKEIPPSLPPLGFENENEFDEDGFSIEKQKAGIKDPQIALTSYLSEELPEGAGEVVGVEAPGAETAGTWQYVFINAPSAQLGEVMSVYSRGPRIEYDGDKYGYSIEYQGVVQIISRARDDEPIFRAMVTSALSQVKLGAKLSRDPIPRVVLDEGGRSNAARGAVIGGHYDPERKVLGLNSIVYLDVGQDHGVNTGDVMNVLRNEKIRNPKTVAAFSTQSIGKIKIAKTTAGRSTGIVIQSKDVIIPGDVVGSVAQTTPQFEEPMVVPETLPEEDLSEDDLELE